MTAKVESHNSLENQDIDLNQYISETCHICNEELVSINDIWVGKDDDSYYCTECKDYHSIKAIRCRDLKY